MTRLDTVVMTATSIPDWTINGEIYGMKLCRLAGLEKVQGIMSLITKNALSQRRKWVKLHMG